MVLPEIIGRGEYVFECFHKCILNTYVGLNVVEIAHDYQAQVQKYIVNELGLINSYDTWHGKYKAQN